MSKGGLSSGKKWRRPELAKLAAMWPKYPAADIRKTFPHRTWMALAQKASMLGLKRVWDWGSKAGRPRQACPNDFLATLRDRRRALKISAENLSKKLGYCQPMVGEWERGRKHPNLFKLEAWTQALGLKLKIGVEPRT